MKDWLWGKVAPVLKTVGLCAALLAALAVINPVSAESAYGRYPNSFSGPYVWEVAVNVQEPTNGAKYAYRMFNTCQVYCRSFHYWYGSTVNATGLNDSYNGWASLDCNTSYGGYMSIGWFGFQGWTPHAYLASRNQYLPSSSGTTITVPSGYNMVTGGTSLTSRTYPYHHSINVWDVNYAICCPEGEGC